MKHVVSSAAAAVLWVGVAGASFAADPQLEKGKALFISEAAPACAVCHTLKDSGSTGTIGPDLDELKPDAARIKKVLQEGMGAMPSFADSLDEASIDAIAAYVVHATGGEK
ncbi:sulfite dehydrogenase (cytochrome) subunit SorB [Advenella kashmirensis W13003]|uniref:Sulfite dehydrogenase (Cytochrome) subunit SorB n=1 Tax=Advenella kashmirensis W13003 TaxID=1424334 RepID=V8QTJ2_9BURK|nr:cytochrome c [Advenella kashmirensis]ETF02957.1 sulfite dehydrogenase (cytochrome) subunit SorB [Advenella kashmirensis W13003]